MSKPMITETKEVDCGACGECADCGDCLGAVNFTQIAAGVAGAITVNYF